MTYNDDKKTCQNVSGWGPLKLSFSTGLDSAKANVMWQL